MFVDSSRFEIIKEQTEPYIAYCGTISREKDGVDILLKAFSVFRQSASDYKLYRISKEAFMTSVSGNSEVLFCSQYCLR